MTIEWKNMAKGEEYNLPPSPIWRYKPSSSTRESTGNHSLSMSVEIVNRTEPGRCANKFWSAVVAAKSTKGAITTCAFRAFISLIP